MDLKNIMKIFIINIVLMISFFRIEAQTINLPDTVRHLGIAKYTSYFNDYSENPILPSAAQFKTFKENIYNFGKQDGNLWVKFILNNQDSTHRIFYLEFTNPNLNSVTLYKVLNLKLVQLSPIGSKYPFKSRPINHQNLIFPIQMDPLEKVEFYVKIHSEYSSTNFNILLWDKTERESYYLKESTTISYFFFITTAFLFILGISLLVTKQVKEWTFFFYILFGACYIYSDLGLSYKNLWGQFPEIQNISSYIFTNFYLILGVSFFREYFVTYRLVKKLDKILKYFIFSSVILTIIALFYALIPQPYFSILQKLNSVLFSFTCSVILFILFILLYRQKNKTETIWFIIAFAPHAYSILTTSIRQLGQYYFNLELDIISKVPFFLWIIHVQNIMLWSMIWEVLIVFTLMMRRLKKVYENHNNMLIELSKKQEENTKLLLATIENERKRIAQELHDGSGVQLSAIRMKLTQLEEQSENQRNREYVEKLMNDVDRVSSDIRTISHNLMPISLSKLGLKAAIQELVNYIRTSYPNLNVNLYQQYDSSKIQQANEVHIYRIIQEILNNIIKHAQANIIHIQLIMNENEMIISIEDNGKGFAYNIEETKGIGLKSIDMRAQLLGGKFEIDSKESAGSFFSITFAIKA